MLRIEYPRERCSGEAPPEPAQTVIERRHRARVHRRASRTAPRPARRSLAKYSGASSDEKWPPSSGEFHRTIFRYRSCAQARGDFSMSRGYMVIAEGTSTRS
jgi:hypothetical protein